MEIIFPFPRMGQNMIQMRPNRKEQTSRMKYKRFLPSTTNPVANLELDPLNSILGVPQVYLI